MDFEPENVSGDENLGLAVFCGGIRFWGIPFGRRSVPTGLQTAGWKGRTIYWPWHEKWSGPAPHPALPALWDVRLQCKHAKKIAEYICDYAENFPGRKVYLIACSAGGGVALRTLRILSKRCCGKNGNVVEKKPLIDAVGLLSVALRPGTDFRKFTASGLTGKVVNFHSALDVIILGAGTAVFGTSDRQHGLSCGMKGLKHTGGGVYNVPFRLSMMKHHRYGGHNSAIKARFIEKCVAPELGMAE